MNMLMQNRAITYQKSKWLYHGILLVSFVAAVLLLPWFQAKTAELITNNIARTAIPYLVAYLAAIHLLPEVGFLIARYSISD